MFSEIRDEKVIEVYIPTFCLIMSSINSFVALYYLFIDVKGINWLIFTLWAFLFYLMALLIENYGLKHFKE